MGIGGHASKLYDGALPVRYEGSSCPNKNIQSSDGALPTAARRAKRDNGGLGEDPPGDDLRTGVSPDPRDRFARAVIMPPIQHHGSLQKSEASHKGSGGTIPQES
jgi:hypothetical protein